MLLTNCVDRPPHKDKQKLETYLNNFDVLHKIPLKSKNPALIVSGNFNTDMFKDNTIMIDFSTLFKSYDLI